MPAKEHASTTTTVAAAITTISAFLLSKTKALRTNDETFRSDYCVHNGGKCTIDIKSHKLQFDILGGEVYQVVRAWHRGTP